MPEIMCRINNALIAVMRLNMLQESIICTRICFNMRVVCNMTSKPDVKCNTVLGHIKILLAEHYTY